MNEKPLERLNYFNGQKLEAKDFKTEQDYHIRTRRWLNKSLYTAGIARGLEVRAVPGKPMVTISPGLALDNDGREIILLDETTEEVISFAGSDATKVEGNYLVIEYDEEMQGHSQAACSAGKPEPSFIVGKPKFSWVPYIPQPGSNQIVLAQVELKPGCKEIEVINLSQRQIVRNASTASVRQYALEGEREVAFIPLTSFRPPADSDVNVRGRVYFHIRGVAQGQAPSVVLYLKAEEFSPLHYTELGRHSHTTTGATSIPDHIISAERLNHFHGLSNVITDIEKSDDLFNDLSPHNHNIRASFAGPFGSLNGHNAIQLTPDKGLGFMRHRVNRDESNDKTPFIIEGAHRHKLIQDGPVDSHDPAYTDTSYSGLNPNQSPIPFTLTLTHNSSTGNPSIDPSGIEFPSRTGTVLAHVDNLQVYIWRVENPGDPSPQDNQTEKILQQLENFYPSWRNLTPAERRLGNGGAGHVFATRGSGAIQLNFLQEFDEGEYCIEFRVKEDRTDANGGKIHYNLYIE